MKKRKLLKTISIILIIAPVFYWMNAISQPKQAPEVHYSGDFSYLGAPAVFNKLDNYCELPENTDECNKTSHHFETPPDVIILIHGMDASMNSYDRNGEKPWGLFVRMARFLQDIGGPNLTVYGVDYNSNGHYCDLYPEDCSKKLPIRIAPLTVGNAALQCNGQQPAGKEWLNCWDNANGFASDELFDYVNDLTVQSVANTIRTIMLTKMADELAGKRIMIIAHSKGGLIARDLLYGPGVQENDRMITGYEQLRNAHIKIDEIMTLVSPHDGGMFYPHESTDDLVNYVCDLADGQEMAVVNQYCSLQDWQMRLQNKNSVWADGSKLELNRIDFPQIQWIAIAGLSMPGPMYYDGKPVATDGAVPIESAFDLVGDANRTSFHYYVPILEYQNSDHSGGQYKDARPAFIKNGNSQLGYDGYWDELQGTDCGNYPNHKNCHWPQNMDALHPTIPNVAYYPNDSESCSYHNDYPYDPACHIDPKGQACEQINQDRRIGCYGWFQYTIPFISLCLANDDEEGEGYHDELPYYKNNPQFKPSTWGCVYQ